MNILSHLQCEKGDIAPIVLMPSNPAKADLIASMLDEAKMVGRYREFTTWTGTYEGVHVSVVSTGIGCPSTAIAIEEVIEGGGQILIRVGTCGGAWRNDIPCGSVVLPSACTREEGTTLEYVPPSFPSIADPDVLQVLRAYALSQNIPAFIGINRTHDAYYGSMSQRDQWKEVFINARVSQDKCPILTSEMECSVFFILASLRGVKAGAVLAVNAEPEPLNERIDAPVMKSLGSKAALSEQRSIEIVLGSISLLSDLI
jgi:uridine phosphorylase